MSVSGRLTKTEKDQLLSDSVQWRVVVEQVTLLIRKDPQAQEITLWLIRWLSEPKNVRRTLQMTMGEIVALGKSMIAKQEAA
jgi:hypothetical protein